MFRLDGSRLRHEDEISVGLFNPDKTTNGDTILFCSSGINADLLEYVLRLAAVAAELLLSCC